MSLKLIKVHEHGKQKTEYIELAVVADCNLKDFIVADTTYIKEGTVSNRLRHMHWFISQAVKAKDRVFLRTCKGTNSVASNPDGSKTYVIYWGIDNPVWNDDGDTALLFPLVVGAVSYKKAVVKAA